MRGPWWLLLGAVQQDGGRRGRKPAVAAQSPGNYKQEERRAAAAGTDRKDAQCPKGRPVLPEPDPAGPFLTKHTSLPALLWRRRACASSPEVPRDDPGCRGVAGGTYRDMGRVLRGPHCA